MSALRVQRRVICVSPCSDSRSGHKAPDLGEGRGCLKAACAERCNNPPDYSPGELQGNLLPWKGIIPALLLPEDFFPFFPKREGSFSLNSCCSSPRELLLPAGTAALMAGKGRIHPDPAGVYPHLPARVGEGNWSLAWREGNWSLAGNSSGVCSAFSARKVLSCCRGRVRSRGIKRGKDKEGKG